MTKILQMLSKVFLGKEVAMALVLLQLISNALSSRNINSVAQLVYSQLPANWKDPKGPATEAEMLDMVSAGQLFLQKVKAVFQA